MAVFCNQLLTVHDTGNRPFGVAGGCHVPEEKQKAGPASHVVLAKHQPSWQDFMRLLMVVQLGAEPTALHLLHRRTPGGHRQALLASGDALGLLQVHTLSGELLAMQATGELQTGTEAKRLPTEAALWQCRQAQQLQTASGSSQNGHMQA